MRKRIVLYFFVDLKKLNYKTKLNMLKTVFREFEFGKIQMIVKFCF